MELLPERGYKRIVVAVLYLICGALIAYIFAKFLFAPLLPFLLAWLAAVMLRPAASALSRRLRIPKKAGAAIVMSAFWLLVAALVFVCADRAVFELKGILPGLAEKADDAIGRMFDFARDITDKIPFLREAENDELSAKIRDAATDFVNSSISALSAGIPDRVAGMISCLPGVFFFLTVLILGSFYFLCDYEAIGNFIVSRLPKKTAELVVRAKDNMLGSLGKYVRSYLLMLIITFAELFVGFMILKIPHAPAIAAVVALVDFLPVLGVGTVLVPWSAFLLIGGAYHEGFGLLILFGVTSLIRRVIEPRVVGAGMGLHPLVMLGVMYFGFKLGGLGGLLLLPLAAMAVKSVAESFRDAKEKES